MIFSILNEQLLDDVDLPIPEIIHGEPFKDRKSIFQAHLAPVFSEKQVYRLKFLFKERMVLLCNFSIFIR